MFQEPPGTGHSRGYTLRGGLLLCPKELIRAGRQLHPKTIMFYLDLASFVLMEFIGLRYNTRGDLAS
jgi:hypothetical protein